MPATNRQTWLLDGNVLIAANILAHPHNARANAWLAAHPDDLLATCSVTEGTLLRFIMRTEPSMAARAAKAWDTLNKFCARPDHVFLEGDFSYRKVNHASLTGHKEVTDAWLAQLARRQGVRVVTFDSGFVVRDPDVAYLIP
ncbi:MAG: PIN domain-containing protein [Puniceicoccales bacterium]|jgi:toxin-antitoxin system PIN domain toxin|nr:PIN domain-containing protein [Puniceicoccales bacterium]